MGKAPYTPSPKNVKKFFEAIKSLGTPPKVTTKFLPNIGFKSSNDRYLIGVTKALGFVDTKGQPTAMWDDFRDKTKAPKVMTEAIRAAYADLFSTYPDAQNRDDETLQNYFASTSKAAVSVASYMVQTFKYLCEFADLGAVTVTEVIAEAPTPTLKKTAKTPIGVAPITININVQLSLPATEDVSIYDKLFEALKKHLFS